MKRLLLVLLVGCGSDPSPGTAPADVPGDIEDIAEDASEVTDDVADAVAADVSEEVAEDVATDAPEEIAEEVTEEVVEDVVEPPVPCGTIVTIESGKTPLRELHVATDGSDQGDGSAASPWASIEHAATQLEPGDALRIHPGTYPGGNFLTDVHGTGEAPIWIGGAPGAEPPVVDATGSSEGIHLVRPRFVVLHDLVVRNAADNGINADDGGAYDDPEAARLVVFRDLTIEDIGPTGNRDCLKLSGLDDYWVLDSSFARCGSGGSAVDHVGCHHGIIARNTFEDLGASGIQNKGGTFDVSIQWNRFLDAGDRPVNMGGSTGLQFFRPPVSDSQPNAEARDIRVVANFFSGGEAAAAFVGCVDCVFAQNTITDPDKWVWRILQEQKGDGQVTFEPVQNGIVANNLVWFSSAVVSKTINIGPDTLAETFSFRHNLWYAHDNPSASAPTLPSPEVGGIVGQDPNFVVGWEPNPTGPAAEAGDPTTLEWIDADMNGQCFGDPPPIGAWMPWLE